MGGGIMHSPAFRRWFGQSTAVDAHGAPRVFHHGTEADFTTFRFGRLDGVAGFFSASADFARSYGPRHLAVYLRIERLFSGEPDVLRAFLAERGGIRALREESLTPISEALGIATDELDDEDWLAPAAECNWAAVELPELVDFLARQGFDAMVVNEFGRRNLAVFCAHQIKSASDNCGAFDPASADITA